MEKNYQGTWNADMMTDYRFVLKTDNTGNGGQSRKRKFTPCQKELEEEKTNYLIFYVSYFRSN